MEGFNDQLKNIQDSIDKANIARSLLLDKALHSDNIDLIHKANNYLRKTPQYQKYLQLQQNNNQDDRVKSILIDPMSINYGLGFRRRSEIVSLELLRKTSHLPHVSPIIGTRTEQVCDFNRPQQDKYGTGFIIEPKKWDSDKKDINDSQKKEIDNLTEFILNCGKEEKWIEDSFDKFIRKFIRDSLSIDQGVFEIITNRGGELIQFIAVDATTFRITEPTENSKEINGYTPHYAQIYENRIVSEFYPWELCFAIRNPQTDIYYAGYGRSELEDLISIITNLLNADAYNGNYFKVGSNPKGIIKVSGNVNQARLEELRDHWQAQVTGVGNAHKTPVIEGDKVDFITTQNSNKDMEYSNFIDFQLRLLCAVYKIDPTEIGLDSRGGSGSSPLFEGNNASRLKYSKDKGLKPLLKFIESNINKYIINQINNKYCFKFVGLDAEDPDKELDRDIKSVSNIEMIDEVRQRRGLKPIGGELGKTILNPVYLQAQSMIQMGSEDSNQFVEEELNEKPTEDADYEDEEQEKEFDPFSLEVEKSVNKYISTE